MQPARETRSAHASATERRVDLVRLAREGNRDAFEQLAVQAMPQLLGTARRLLREPYAAEEAVAEALFRGYRRMRDFRAKAAFGTWIHRILCRVAIDRFRRQRRDRAHHEALAEAARAGRAPGARPGLGSHDKLVLDEEARQLRLLVERLPPRQRLVLVLHVWEGLSLSETAEVLGVRYTTAKSNLCHARIGLRRLLEAEGGAR